MNRPTLFNEVATRLSPTVRSAERLHGTLVPCGPGMRPVAWPESPRVRLQALAEICPPQLVITLGTAAWVWGAARTAPLPLDVACGVHGASSSRFNTLLSLRNLVFRPSDVQDFGVFSVTSPERTVTDLLRLRERFHSSDRAVCRLLIRLVPGGLQAIRAQLGERASPHSRRALQRLAAL